MSSTSSSYCLQVKATPEKMERFKKKKRERYKKIQALFPAGSICVVCSAGEFLLWEISTAPRGLREMCWRGSSAPFFRRPSNLVPSRLWWPRGLWMCLGPENEHRTNTQSESRGLELEPWLCPSLMDIQCWPGASGISRELFSSGIGEISSLASPRLSFPCLMTGSSREREQMINPSPPEILNFVFQFFSLLPFHTMAPGPSRGS